MCLRKEADLLSQVTGPERRANSVGEMAVVDRQQHVAQKAPCFALWHTQGRAAAAKNEATTAAGDGQAHGRAA